MIAGVHHVGIAFRTLQEGIDFYRQTFGLEAEVVEPPAGSSLQFAVVRLPGCEVELLAPNAADTPISRFLETRGPGVHHLAFEVEDISAAMKAVAGTGTSPLEPEPLPGIEDTLTCFFHPKATLGVLYEFVEPARAAKERHR